MREVFKEYNIAWKLGKIEKPVAVLIGGHIGTGKSSFAKLLEGYIDSIYQIPTGVIRAIQQVNTTPDEEPLLFAHSYELHNRSYDPSLTLEQRALLGFKGQSKIIERAVINILRFSETEGQQIIIEGNHILPGFVAQQPERKNIISLFFKTTDKDKYTQMISGPTHKRTFTDEQLYLVRHIHDFITDEAIKHDQPLFEYNQTDQALTYVAQRLEELTP